MSENHRIVLWIRLEDNTTTCITTTKVQVSQDADVDDLKVAIQQKFEKQLLKNVDAPSLKVMVVTTSQEGTSSPTSTGPTEPGKLLEPETKVATIQSKVPLLVKVPAKKELGISNKERLLLEMNDDDETDKDVAARMSIKCEAYDSLSVVSTLVFGSAILHWRDDLMDESAELSQTVAGRCVIVLGALTTCFSLIATVMIVMDSYFARQLLGKKHNPGTAAHEFLYGNTPTKHWRLVGIHATFLSILLLGAQAIARIFTVYDLYEATTQWRSTCIGSTVVLGLALAMCGFDWIWDCKTLISLARRK